LLVGTTTAQHEDIKTEIITNAMMAVFVLPDVDCGVHIIRPFSNFIGFGMNEI
jgi:hypothetical protein